MRSLTVASTSRPKYYVEYQRPASLASKDLDLFLHITTYYAQ
jgi:hypothetical protein